MTAITATIQIRRDTAVNWTSNNPTLLAGELGVETDSYATSGTHRLYRCKLGDGSWNSLPYAQLGDAIGGGSGTIAGSGTANEIPYWVNSNTLGTLEVATYPSLTELSYVKGLTSAVQTQISSKWAVNGNTLGNDTSWIGSSDNYDFLIKTNNTTRVTVLKTGLAGFGVSPTAIIHAKGLGNTSATFGLKVENLAGTVSLQVQDDGAVYNQGKTASIYNTYFGLSSGIANLGGILNTGFGWETLKIVTTGNSNTGFGSGVLSANVTGTANTGVGNYALRNATNSFNTAIGEASSQNLVGGNSNTSIGEYSLRNNTAGSWNLAAGRSAASVMQGSYSVILGAAAATNATADGNTIIGYNSGLFLTTGTYNVFIGHQSAYYETGSRTLIIDTFPRASEADGRVKSLVYGIFDAAVANQRLTVNASLIVGSAALATTATDGFLYIPSCAGTPTGAPTAQTGTVPMVWDSTNKKFYIYDGSWLGGTAPGVFS